ncbi:23S rRNA (adenine(2503)-C(2))-methyltransferase RlmN [Peptococcus niger]|uniref:Probable dual-specificity RNA methyltransferase RlmN n=1 Tax=Peptococcus niger TaxID=2741 RepID=A0A1G6RVG3_PEPNI|nr:23S rRNA (adenine(2503)-C(2))-methyltransferase RlmN [Peptococcus niger]SDD08423.1 23S rRNA m(2)A-2503 methyltransferase [Peptococcus niger]
MADLRNLSFAELAALLATYGEPSFRAKQLFAWLHNRQINDLAEAHNISHRLVERLTEDGYGIHPPHCMRRQVSKDGTEKYLLELEDGLLIECVLMKYRGDYSKQRNTLCVSSQVGCAMGCSFCATGTLGFSRQLSVAEILGQVYASNALLKEDAEPMQVRNLVFMGMGEPFANFDAVMKAIEILCDKRGADMAQRRMTISTCGLVPEIKRFADLQTDIGLAISLHASNDETRQALMPVDKTYPLADLMEACHYYCNKTGRRISFEYALIAGVNDGKKEVSELVHLVKGIDCHFNIIPVNPVSGKNFSKPSVQASRAFQQKLTAHGLLASIREEKGADIDGACGQLKANYLKPLSS